VFTNVKSITPHDFNSSISVAVSFLHRLGLVVVSQDLKYGWRGRMQDGLQWK